MTIESEAQADDSGELLAKDRCEVTPGAMEYSLAHGIDPIDYAFRYTAAVRDKGMLPAGFTNSFVEEDLSIGVAPIGDAYNIWFVVDQLRAITDVFLWPRDRH